MWYTAHETGSQPVETLGWQVGGHGLKSQIIQYYIFWDEEIIRGG